MRVSWVLWLLPFLLAHEISASPGGLPADASARRNRAVSPVEVAVQPADLLAAIRSRRSEVLVDITVDRFDGAAYMRRDPLKVRVSADRGGFLYLIHRGPDGRLAGLSPATPRWLNAGQSLSIDPSQWERVQVTAVPGQQSLLAIVIDHPLRWPTTDLSRSPRNRLSPSTVACRRWLPAGKPNDRPAAYGHDTVFYHVLSN